MGSRSTDRSNQPWIERVDARVMLSVVLVLHLTAVFIAPMNIVFPQRLPESREEWPLVPWLANFFEPYLDAAYLNHGYHFFAPDPPAWSSLIDYRGQRADGSTFEGTIPDLQEHWPRLFYHRHFMLTEQRYFLPEGAEEAYARHLLKANNGVSIRLDAVSHLVPSPEEVSAGTRLDDARLYERNEILTITADGQVRRPAEPEVVQPEEVLPEEIKP